MSVLYFKIDQRQAEEDTEKFVVCKQLVADIRKKIDALAKYLKENPQVLLDSLFSNTTNVRLDIEENKEETITFYPCGYNPLLHGIHDYLGTIRRHRCMVANLPVTMYDVIVSKSAFNGQLKLLYAEFEASVKKAIDNNIDFNVLRYLQYRSSLLEESLNELIITPYCHALEIKTVTIQGLLSDAHNLQDKTTSIWFKQLLPIINKDKCEYEDKWI